MNVTGAKTLFLKEIRRFLRVPGQTVLSPLVSTTLYFVVFGYSLRGRAPLAPGADYLSFIVPGLVFLGIANNAFLNTSSSLFITKIQGTVVDLLVAPLSPIELLTGFIGGGMVRGLAVGLLTYLVAILFTGFELARPLLAMFLLLLSSYVFAMLGMLTGLWAEKFEQINFVPTFVMLPLTFLGGVFYSVTELPEPWRTISHFNPIVYMVEGLRAAVLGTSSLPVASGVLIQLGLAAASTAACAVLLRRGYRLKS